VKDINLLLYNYIYIKYLYLYRNIQGNKIENIPDELYRLPNLDNLRYIFKKYIIKFFIIYYILFIILFL